MTLPMRSWATPLTAATFMVGGVTGLLLFFHAPGTLSRVAHEWIGLAIVAAVALHLAVNWRPLKSYLRKPVGASILGLGLVATLLTAIPLTGTGAPQLNPRAIFGAMETASLSALAGVVGTAPEALVTDLRSAGFDSATLAASPAEIAAATGANPAAVLAVVFARD